LRGLETTAATAEQNHINVILLADLGLTAPASGESTLQKGETMTTYESRNYRRNRRIAFIYAGAVCVAFVTGTFALLALRLGSPLEFGSALAACGVAWIVAHFAEQTAEQQTAHRRRALPKW
jgi:hypothetical protein